MIRLRTLHLITRAAISGITPFLVVTLILVAGPEWASAQDASTRGSYQRARAIVDRALTAHGGAAAARWNSLTLSYEGVRHMRHQSFRFEGPWDVQQTEWTSVVDFQGERMRRDFVERYPKDFEFAGRNVFTADGGFRVDPTRQHMGDVLTRFQALNFERARQGLDFDVPILMVQRALRRTATLRSLGQLVESGRRFDVVTFADQDGSQVSLLFDTRTGLLDRYERLGDDGVDGDLVAAVGFDDYRAVGGVQFPFRRQEWSNGALVRDGTLSVAVNTGPPDSLFAEPEGYTDPAPREAEGEAVRQLAENVWLIQQSGNRVLFVAFRDHVLVFETPLPQTTATMVMEIVQRTVPGKPIRYVAFSHHHDDHAGGLRPYIAEGITIVTTPASLGFIEHVAEARHTIAPDTLSRAPRAPVVETFSGHRVFTDGSTVVELHELGPNSHVDEMVLVWLPNERLIFQGDLLILPVQGEPAPANTLAVEFLRKIDAMGWPVETIAGVHGRVGTIDDLRAAVARRGRN